MSSQDPTLKNIVAQTSLRWIFVGGKGGVGKTTISSSLAIQLSQSREKVLIISTDPAHNLSDSFNQKLSSNPTQINGLPNLFGAEIETKSSNDDVNVNNILGFEVDDKTKSVLNDLTTSIPGIDEAMSLGYIMKIVKEMKFDCVVFDTAPTGHTLRLLNFPHLMEKGLETLLSFKDKLGGIVQSLGILGGNSMENVVEKLFYSISSLKENMDLIKTQFTDRVSIYNI
jgi:arsenite-transporting ATPase